MQTFASQHKVELRLMGNVFGVAGIWLSTKVLDKFIQEKVRGYLNYYTENIMRQSIFLTQYTK